MVYLLLLFTLVPVFELFLLLKIGGQIGALLTISLVLFTGILGAIMARSQGRQVLLNIRQQLQRGQMPGESLVHGLLIFIGGLFLVTPGFLTDLWGLSMLLPWTRGLMANALRQFLDSKMSRGDFRVNVGRVDEYGSVHWDEPQWREVSPESVTGAEADVIDINRMRQTRRSHGDHSSIE